VTPKLTLVRLSKQQGKAQYSGAWRHPPYGALCSLVLRVPSDGLGRSELNEKGTSFLGCKADARTVRLNEILGIISSECLPIGTLE
jgi:hypothetical protein